MMMKMILMMICGGLSILIILFSWTVKIIELSKKPSTILILAILSAQKDIIIIIIIIIAESRIWDQYILKTKRQLISLERHLSLHLWCSFFLLSGIAVVAVVVVVILLLLLLIIIIIIITTASLEWEWQQVSSGIQDFPQYSCRS